MAKFVPFFPRQTVVGGGTTAATYYSEIFEIAEAKSLYILGA